MKYVYELKRFKQSDDKDFTKALTLYSANIEPRLRTDTREIIYWVDNYAKKFLDKFFVFGFYLNNEIIGFAELAYFIEEKLIFVDYIVIDKNYRRNNTFYEFVEQIKEYLTNVEIVFDFVIAEVGGFDEKEPAVTTRSLIRLLKMSGFGVIKNNYWHPRLGKNNYESELLSILMLYTSNDLKTLKKDTYLLLLNTIYYKHYKRWYDIFLSESEQIEYTKNLLELISKTEYELRKKDIIEINGYPNSYSSGSNINKFPKYTYLAKIVAVFALFVFFSVSFAIIHEIVKTKYGIDTTAQSYIVIASIIGVLFVISLFAERKTSSITNIIEKIINKFTG